MRKPAGETNCESWAKQESVIQGEVDFARKLFEIGDSLGVHGCADYLNSSNCICI